MTSPPNDFGDRHDHHAVGSHVGPRASWVPTRKWLATTGLAVLTIVVMFVSEGSIDFTNGLEADEWALLGILAQRVLAYLVANKATSPMTGVPAEHEKL